MGYLTRLLLLLVLAAGLASFTACAEEETGSEEPPAEEEEDNGGGGEDTGDEDTGRMSDGEFEMFSDYDLEFAGELEDWSGGYAACATIGQAGDLAGFRTCIDDEWDGVEDAGLLAYGNAEDTFDDVAKDCLTKLKAYANEVDRVYSQNLNAYEAAKSLNARQIKRAFRPLARAAKGYAAASATTRDACNPT